MSKVSFPVTDDPDADALLVSDPLALVIGMVLDQQVPMEWAFRSPNTLKTRLGERFTAEAIAAMDPEDLVEVFCEKPALHRYPAAMARRIHDLCIIVVEQYDGDPARIWKGVRSGESLFERVSALPGFGTEKSQIFVALLAKRFHRAPTGWEAVAGAFADDEPRSVADISSREAFAEVRAWKKAQKAAKKSKSEFSTRS
ncbi:MAG: HhH-GPD-type base excision DNA repair protein [Aquihabitans sp.]